MALSYDDSTINIVVVIIIIIYMPDILAVTKPTASKHLGIIIWKVTAIATRKHWIQHITFAAETSAADTHTEWQREAEDHSTFAG